MGTDELIVGAGEARFVQLENLVNDACLVLRLVPSTSYGCMKCSLCFGGVCEKSLVK